MTDTRDTRVWKLPETAPSPVEFAQAWSRVVTNAADLVRASAERATQPAPPLPYDPAAPEPVIAPERGDRRFADPAWSEEPIFDYLKQAYLLASKRMLDAVDGAEGIDDATRAQASFYTQSVLNALSPANFPHTNPEAIRRAIDTGSVSLISGLANFLADAATQPGIVQRRASKEFELGVDIAATPGSVVFQNELMQLIQYAPTSDQVVRRPVLYVPPLVNKYYLLDLQPKSSLLRWLVGEGHTVFVVSWINPGSELADMGMADYIKLGPIAALDAIEQATGERQVDLFGFCMGGTLAAMAAAYLAGRGEGERIASVTTIGSLLDFAELGQWATFTDPEQLQAFERHLEHRGFLAAQDLQALFSAVRANDLIWSSVVSHYLLDKEAPPSDILYWFADGAHIPRAFLLEYTTQLLRDNKLRQPQGVVLDGVPLDIGAIQAPLMAISLKDDHVSAWTATYESARLWGGPRTFLLGGSGHNAGVINPPSANKHGFWINPDMPETAEAWLDSASRGEGSWWPHWQGWLAKDQERVPARVPGDSGLPVIEPAPGSYVRMKG
jgi:polyhydroxyalkanoate synthase